MANVLYSEKERERGRKERERERERGRKDRERGRKDRERGRKERERGRKERERGRKEREREQIPQNARDQLLAIPMESNVHHENIELSMNGDNFLAANKGVLLRALPAKINPRGSTVLYL